MKSLEDKGDEIFLRAWLRAQYAEVQLIKEDFSDFAKIYRQIKQAEKTFSDATKYIFYNAQLTFTMQQQMLMAPICPDDASTTVAQKINLTARFIDLWVNTRVMNRKSLSYNTIQDYIFRIAKDIRGCSIGELKAKLKAHYDALNYRPEATVANHKLHRGTNAQHTALRRTHDDYNRFLGSKFFNKEEFDIYWNKIGALLLLRKSINSSLNDSDYPQKLIKYCSADGNIYAASLGEQTYRHNPRFKRFATDNNLLFKPCKKIRQGGD